MVISNPFESTMYREVQYPRIETRKWFENSVMFDIWRQRNGICWKETNRTENCEQCFVVYGDNPIHIIHRTIDHSYLISQTKLKLKFCFN